MTIYPIQKQRKQKISSIGKIVLYFLHPTPETFFHLIIKQIDAWRMMQNGVGKFHPTPQKQAFKALFLLQPANNQTLNTFFYIPYAHPRKHLSFTRKQRISLHYSSEKLPDSFHIIILGDEKNLKILLRDRQIPQQNTQEQ